MYCFVLSVCQALPYALTNFTPARILVLLYMYVVMKANFLDNKDVFNGVCWVFSMFNCYCIGRMCFTTCQHT
jgi:hypothetical protein